MITLFANTYRVLMQPCCFYHVMMFSFLVRNYPGVFGSCMNSALTKRVCVMVDKGRFEQVYEMMGEEFLRALKVWFEANCMNERADLVQHTIDAMNMDIKLVWEEEK